MVNKLDNVSILKALNKKVKFLYFKKFLKSNVQQVDEVTILKPLNKIV